MRVLVLAMIVLGASMIALPVADACVPPNCPGWYDCKLTEKPWALPTGHTVWVPQIDCYY